MADTQNGSGFDNRVFVLGDGTFIPYQLMSFLNSGAWTPVTNGTGLPVSGFVGSTSGPINVAQVTVSTTAVQLSSTSTVPANGILVGGLSTNAASIFIGGSGVTTSSGAEIQPGAIVPFTCNLNTLYIISAASTTDKVWYNVT